MDKRKNRLAQRAHRHDWVKTCAGERRLFFPRILRSSCSALYSVLAGEGGSFAGPHLLLQAQAEAAQGHALLIAGVLAAHGHQQDGQGGLPALADERFFCDGKQSGCPHGERRAGGQAGRGGAGAP